MKDRYSASNTQIKPLKQKFINEYPGKLPDGAAFVASPNKVNRKVRDLISRQTGRTDNNNISNNIIRSDQKHRNSYEASPSNLRMTNVHNRTFNKTEAGHRIGRTADKRLK